MPQSPLPPPIHEPLGVLLGTRAKVDLLRVLTARGAPLSQRELARRAGVSLRGAQAALADFYALGIATRLQGGRDHLTLLNEQHALAPALTTLFSAEAELARGLRHAIAAAVAGDRNPPMGLYLFGSVARAEETPDSDVDVLVIARDVEHREQLMERSLTSVETLRTQYGVTMNPVAYTIREARRGWADGTALWAEIARDAVTIQGPALVELLK